MGGVRALAYRRRRRLRLASNWAKRDITAADPEVRGRSARAVGAHEAVLDGEMVAFDEAGRPASSACSAGVHLTSESLVAAHGRDPVVYVSFDAARRRHLDGAAIAALRAAPPRLRELDLTGPAWQTPAHHVGDGAAMLEACARRARGDRGGEADRLPVRRRAGARTAGRGQERAPVRRRRRRWMPGRRPLVDVGALAIGWYDDEGGARAVPAASVGSGSRTPSSSACERLLEPLARRHSRSRRARNRPKARVSSIRAGRGRRLRRHHDAGTLRRALLQGPARRPRPGRRPATPRRVDPATGPAGAAPRPAKMQGMARSMWSGAISFGLVNVPIKLYSAVSRRRPSGSTSSMG